MKKSPVIVIPVYKSQINHLEELAIQQCFKMLGNHRIVVIKPNELSLDHYSMTFPEVISLDNEYFANITGYNRLMLHSSFYELFLDHEYLLIYQPDAFVFKDELTHWCSQGYDYIGAPWLRYAGFPDFIKKYKNYILRHVHTKLNITQPGTYLPTDIQFENRVGNGGFSLRKVSRFYAICKQEEKMIDLYNGREEYQFAEDVFWSIEVNRHKNRLKIPNFKTAVYFAFENNPSDALGLTKGAMPFGCHAWDRHLNFWEPIFKELGVSL
ncbi:MAG: DUF5672 family protein [Pedobacter sp.]